MSELNDLMSAIHRTSCTVMLRDIDRARVANKINAAEAHLLNAMTFRHAGDLERAIELCDVARAKGEWLLGSYRELVQLRLAAKHFSEASMEAREWLSDARQAGDDQLVIEASMFIAIASHKAMAPSPIETSLIPDGYQTLVNGEWWLFSSGRIAESPPPWRKL